MTDSNTSKKDESNLRDPLPPKNPGEKDSDSKPNFIQIIISTLGAAFGVQSNKNRERDFKGGSITTYIIAGIVFTVTFVLVVAMIVRAVLNASGV